MISVLIFQLNMVGVLSAKGYGGTTQHASATVSTLLKYSHEVAKTFFPSLQFLTKLEGHCFSSRSLR